MNNTRLGSILQDRRKAAGITQRDVAELGGVAVHTISDLESGKGNPTLEVLSSVCEVLGLEIVLQPKVPTAMANANN